MIEVDHIKKMLILYDTGDSSDSMLNTLLMGQFFRPNISMDLIVALNLNCYK